MMEERAERDGREEEEGRMKERMREGRKEGRKEGRLDKLRREGSRPRKK